MGDRPPRAWDHDGCDGCRDSMSSDEDATVCDDCGTVWRRRGHSGIWQISDPPEGKDSTR